MNLVRVEDDELVGHGVFRGKDAGKMPSTTRFWEEQVAYFDSLVSVDRLTYADRHVLCEVHDEEAAARGPGRRFHGWYRFEVRGLREDRLDVVPSDSTSAKNIWHADLKIPGVDLGDPDSIVQGAAKLRARVTDWEPRVLNSEAQRDVDQATGGLTS